MLTQNTLVEKMSTQRKLELFFTHLKSGNELVIGGRTYVWLDNHITREEMNDQGQMLYFGIDGLALKCESFDTVTSEESIRYIGQGDLPLHYLESLVDELSEEQLLGITAGIALRGMNKKRMLKSES